MTTERVTHDSPRTTAPNAPSWMFRAVLVGAAVLILFAILLAVRLGVGGRNDAASNPADTPEEIREVSPTAPITGSTDAP